ncbi:MAG: UDP-N-acetylmuramate--L-alanine ligase [Putridiphycobacter sp.]
MKFKDINNVYFVGIGGIGMSALARFFYSEGKHVMGYDKTKTTLTETLETEGLNIHYSDLGENALNDLDPTDTLVIYTPAIPENHQEIIAFKKNGFNIIKRAKALGIISSEKETFAVAGTHGKTTTSSILAHVLYQTEQSCNAFIGGITSNYNSNCLINEKSNRVVVEADEFDRSFLQLKPNYTIITTMDADHLDIYGDESNLKQSFFEFAGKTNANGLLMVHQKINFSDFKGATKYKTYGFEEGANWKGENLRYENGYLFFDIINGTKTYASVQFGLPGKHNAENALAVFGLLIEKGISESEIRAAFKSYKGVKRRFDYHIRRPDLTIIDDYAHHPKEITAFLKSVKEIYPKKKITAIFQPHLFSRTRDFMNEFAEALGLADQLFLLDIYPARELPIEGITSKVLLDKINLKEKYLSSKANIISDLHQHQHDIITIIGAGDIDTTIKPITQSYE